MAAKIPNDYNLATLLAHAIIIAGCGGSSSTPGPIIPPPSAELDCVTTGIPCALSDVPLAVLERSDEIADNSRT